MVSRPRGYNQVGTAVLSVENTHNFGGGRVADIEQLRILRARTREAGVAVHVDGARLANATAATGIGLGEYGALADSVSLCLSKGLGAPVGSVLVGSADLIAEARILRKRYGGGMRQAGILAAAGLWALDHNLERLAEDNERAWQIARAIAEVAPASVAPDTVDTNIVFIDLGPTGLDAQAYAAATEAAGVRVSVMDEDSVRIVTHLDVSAEDALRAGEILARAVDENA